MAEQRVYGGQAVLEGVMMRGRRDMAVAVRLPSGEIAVWHEPLSPATLAQRMRSIPLVRGVFVLWDTLVLGMRALVFSANVSLVAEQPSAEGRSAPGQATSLLWLTVAVSLLFSIGLFFVAPLAVVSLADRWIASDLLSNLAEGMIRLAVLIGYLGLIGQMSDIRRVFGYHGAEHKAINAYEARQPLTVETVRHHSLLHPRCGTGFILIVVLISILVFALLGRPPLVWRVLSRIVLVPVIAALAYEFIRWTAAHYRYRVVRFVTWPSIALQRLTTREPDDGMLEVAIVALRRVLAAEGRDAAGPEPGSPVVPVDQSGQPLVTAS
ncbi:DUF1385 domain-containing protein [Thermomicrobiaceae bacterium CFH 74404]|uniref:DUF1385 domain-containing protein n=1 Tax=Thermalbibacter longus TaxID=2951981 RepID=A0AA42BDM0_9BACT|nr:DUF1385 domain-containing protein [Thermalbibacter longus]MCM8749868.1 DUF1385 domain-containing protein [Thermalbibacter longus]